MTATLRTYSLRLLAVLFLALSTAYGQAPLPPVEERPAPSAPKVPKTERLSPEAKELGKEYLELLHELQEVMQDYSRYMAKLNGSLTKEQRKELAQLMKKLAQGAYLRNLYELDADLVRTQQELALNEAVLKKQNQKAYAITRNLQRSLEAINIQLESEVESQLEQEEADARALEALLEATAAGGQADPDKLREVYVQLAGDESGLRITIPEFDFNFNFDFSGDSMDLAGLRELGDSFRVVVPKPPKDASGVYVVPDVPSAPSIVIGGRNIIFTGNTGETQVVREFSDSLRISGRTAPIAIDNPNGDLRLTGWDRNLVLVRSQIGVGADSPDAAEHLAEAVHLQLKQAEAGYTIGYAMPALSDPRQQVTSRYLEVMVPAGNPISVTSAFGTTSIVGLNNSLTVTANHAPIEIMQIVGNVAVTSSMAPVSLAEIDGAITLTNHHAPVSLTQCSGAIAVTNEYGPVELDQCDGRTSIRNVGEVSIGNHTGDVTIDNSNGLVSVSNSEGDFRITNAYQPLQIESVDGSVSAGNSHAPILISDITGAIKANTTYAPIELSESAGPITLSNTNGPILVNCTDRLSGPSDIQVTNGMVNISLPPTMNLLLRATAVGGDIQSSFPMRRTVDGSRKVAELSLGSAKPSLTVTGTGSQILVVEKD